jgi:TPR repeat protein
MSDDPERLKIAADRGDPEAMFELAEVRRAQGNGLGTSESFEPLYRAAAEAGHLGAIRELGLWLWGTRGPDPERELEGTAFVAQAADLGDTKAMMAMGHLCRQRGEESAGLAWFHRASDLGNPVATAQIGRYHLLAGRLAEAEHWLGEAVERGDCGAIPPLVEALVGQGRSAEIEPWYRLGVERGDVASMISLGRRLLDAGDVTEAEDLLRRSAGTLDGMGALGDLLVRTGREEEGRPLLERVEDAWRNR